MCPGRRSRSTFRCVRRLKAMFYLASIHLGDDKPASGVTWLQHKHTASAEDGPKRKGESTAPNYRRYARPSQNPHRIFSGTLS